MRALRIVGIVVFAPLVIALYVVVVLGVALVETPRHVIERVLRGD